MKKYIKLKSSPNSVVADRHQIGASQWKPVFKLLALIVLADGKVRPESVKAFQDSLLELRAIIDPKLVMTRHMVLDWFKLNKDQLASAIYSLEYEDTLLSLINEMKSFPYKLDVITCMVKIATSDGEYSKTEKLLIKKTISYWNVSDNTEAPQSRVTAKAAISETMTSKAHETV